MALINFDCPECGHNLEVDENGAGFIIKCPECDNPLQIPDLPKSRRIRKAVIALATLLAILLLFAMNLVFWDRNQSLRGALQQQEEWDREFRQHAQVTAMQQDAEIARWKQAAEDARIATRTGLADAALDAIEEAERLAHELEDTRRRLLESSASERTRLLRQHMQQRVEAAKNSLPAAPLITDVAPDRGIQGRQIVFPVLPGPDGQTLRENAEVTGVEQSKVSFRFAGGTASYLLTELHPGVAAFLPVDPLLVLPRPQWGNEAMRILQTSNARREEQVSELRRAIEQFLPSE
jgi:hypothetical protein